MMHFPTRAKRSESQRLLGAGGIGNDDEELLACLMEVWEGEGR